MRAPGEITLVSLANNTVVRKCEEVVALDSPTKDGSCVCVCACERVHVHVSVCCLGCVLPPFTLGPDFLKQTHLHSALLLWEYDQS